MLLLIAETQPTSVNIDTQTWAIIVGTITVLGILYKTLDKYIDDKLAIRKEKNGNGKESNGKGCVGRSGPLPLSEKSLAKAVDEVHEVLLQGGSVSEVQRQRTEGHRAAVETRDFTKIVARELVRARITNGKKHKPNPDNDKTGEYDAIVDKMIKDEEDS